MAKKKPTSKAETKTKEKAPEQPETQKEFTPEQIEEMRQKQLEFYNKQLELLKPQHEYEKLTAEIEEFRLRKLTASLQRAQILMGPPEDEEYDDEDPDQDPDQEQHQESKEPVHPEASTGQDFNLESFTKHHRKLKTD